MESKKRTSNFTPDEKRILSELVLKYKDNVENKKTDAVTNAQKMNAWIRLANEFNSISTFCYRTHQSLKTCWDNIKRQSKKDRANFKKEMFKTGGGLPPKTMEENKMDGIVEAVLGPAAEGIPNHYDSDGLISNVIEVQEVNESDLFILPNEYNSQEELPTSPSTARVIICNEDTKENMMVYDQSQDNIPAASDIIDSEFTASTLKQNNDQPSTTPSTSRVIFVNDNSTENDMQSWTDWTPKTLKRPLADSLRVINRKTEKSIKRRRPANENLQDQVLQEKVALVKLLKQKAEEEANIRILILKEQLKQEQLKTAKMSKE